MKEEIWKGIEGYEEYYQVSSYGRVKSLERLINHPLGGFSKIKTKILKFGVDLDGYLLVGLHKNGKSKTEKVHRLVAKAFLSRYQFKKEVNHINGVKADNFVGNLEWVNRSENNIHAYNTGLRIGPRGEAQGNSRLTEDQVLEIRGSELPQKELAKIYGVHQSTISNIISRRRWSHM